MTDTSTSPTPIRDIAGTVGFLLGGLALALVVVLFVAGPFAPQQTAGVTLGEMASDMGKAALRDMAGIAQPAPDAAPWDLDRGLKAAAMGLAVLAVLLGLFGLVRHESRQLAASAAALGISAILVQLFATTVILIASVVMVLGFLYFLRGSLAGFLGG